MSIGRHDDVGLRLLDQQVGNIDEAAEGREQLQIHLQQVGAKQRRGIRRLQPVEHEVADLRAQMGPIEGKGAEFRASAGSGLHGGDDLLPHHVAKPIRAHDRDAGHEEDENQPEQPAAGPQQDTLRAGQFRAAHWKASFLN